MTGEPSGEKGNEQKDLAELVGAREERKLRARNEEKRGLWFGLGMFGLIGWSVAIPTVLGIAVGVWLDERWPEPPSWTLMGLVLGICVGCLNAWYWLRKEADHE